MRISTLRCNDEFIIAHLIYAMQFNARDQTYRYQFSRFEEIGQVDWLHTFINQLFKECLCFFVIPSLLALHIELCSYGDFNGIEHYGKSVALKLCVFRLAVITWLSFPSTVPFFPVNVYPVYRKYLFVGKKV